MSDLSKILPASPITEKDIYDNINVLREARDQFEELTLLDTAKFFTDKLITILKDDNKDEVYRMAKLLHEKEEFHRAAFFIVSRNFHQSDLSCRYLSAKCYFDCREYTKALEILSIPIQENITYDTKHGTLCEWQSSIELLKGNTFEAMGNREIAKKCFIEALKLNIFCSEAFHSFIRFDMISKDEEKELLSILDFDKKKFSSSPEQFIKYFYLNELNTKGRFKSLSHDDDLLPDGSLNIDSLEIVKGVSSSIDVRLNKAEQLFNTCQYKQCYQIVSEVYSEDLYNPRCLLLNIGCLMELKKEIVLQEMAHKLVEVYPENPISWYAVGCYYYITSNADTARKYFSKSTLMDNRFQPSMLMYAHSFEMESLHDQAMAVYLDLSKAMPSSFLPLLYVGVEYSHLNNAIMAERYIKEALQLSPDDLFVLHELAIVCYQKKDYEAALSHFSTVYDMLSKEHLMTTFPEKWEPLLNNMGHVCRKLGKYDQAISFHKQALEMIPQNASTYDSIGLVYSLKGKLQMACDFFQKSLSLKRDDAFASTIYNIVYQEIIDKEMRDSMKELESFT